MTSLLRSLANFMEPTGVVWLILTVLVVASLRRRRWRMLSLAGTAWVILSLSAGTMLPHVLLGALESQWAPMDVMTVPECDVIVVLGGGLEPSVNELAGLHLKSAGDRLFTGLMLAKKGRGKNIVLGGGGYHTAHGTKSEADGAKRWVEEWQLSPVPIQSLGMCLDTHDEAVKVTALAAKNGWKRVALVTSAYHMTRSKAVFEAAGTAVIPVPCNYLSSKMRGNEEAWLNVPNATSLSIFETWMHEVIGWWAYKVAGWI